MNSDLLQMRPTAQRPLNGLTLLIVDDSRYASEAFRLMARHSGARVRRANCMASAQDHLASYRPHSMIVDLGLPDGDGTQLIAQMHQASIRPRVILGSSGDTDRETDVLNAGAQGFLPKPVDGLAAFQQAILKHLPADEKPTSPYPVSNTQFSPDQLSFQEDLAEAHQRMAQDPTGADAAYLSQFVLGVARLARDTPLEKAAQSVSCPRSTRQEQEGLTQLFHLVQERIQERAVI